MRLPEIGDKYKYLCVCGIEHTITITEEPTLYKCPECGWIFDENELIHEGYLVNE